MLNLEELYELRTEAAEYGQVPSWLEKRTETAETLRDARVAIRKTVRQIFPYLFGNWLVLLTLYLLNPFGVFR